jgi:ferric-dicitrate binding protein FerR (iron transport regulator)
MKKRLFTQLLDRYVEGIATDQETALVEDYLDELEKGPVKQRSQKEDEAIQARMLKHIQSGLNGKKGLLVSMSKAWRVAAAAILIIGLAGGYVLFTKQKQNNNQQTVANKDIPPGGDKAILTLADGSKIVLTDVNNGAIADQGNVKVIKLDGQVSYSSNGNADEVVYNTISTPRTGQYQLILADGSKVWLDAESSIRFPNIFKGNERRVELKGQGYFEIAHNSKMPFHVSVGSMDVQVLGTHFNIMAYGNEDAIKTTLLEGSVKVQTNAGSPQTTILKPGSQAQLGKDNVLKSVSNINMDQVMAWKNGLFQLEGTSIREVFRQIERWYDVDVIVQENLGDENLSGVFSRKQYVSQLLKILEEAGVGHFKIDGKKIYVTN